MDKMTSQVTITRGTNDKPVSSQALARFFADYRGCSGHLLIGFPVIGTSDGRYFIDALLVSPELGVVIFDLVEGGDPGDYAFRQDDAVNKLSAKLRTNRDLMDRRELLIPVDCVSFAPGIHDVARHSRPEYAITNMDTLHNVLAQMSWVDSEDQVFWATLSAIQSISTIRKSRIKRSVSREDSRGAKLKRLEDSIATFDSLQSKAVIETADGVQRIRGLAGSGKTIVLALKAAYLHTQHPEWRIAVTFHTRSLKGQFRRLINNFTVELTGEEPDWDTLRILSSWGAPGGGERQGVYHEFCRVHDVEYLDLRAARRRFGQGNEFSGACEQALAQSGDKEPLYEVILIDEAQDFPPSFLRLCYDSLGDHKRLVYAYDELQNLSGSSLPPPEQIFGTRLDGTPTVTFDDPVPGEPRRDIILEKCYRNSRPILTTAHSLGFGIYREPPAGRDTGLVQMFDQPQLWNDIGYIVKYGNLIDDAPVALSRTQDTSPKFLEEHSMIDDLVQFHVFERDDDQAEWLTNAIHKNIQDEELRHDDIIVINPNPLTTRERVGPIRSR